MVTATVPVLTTLLVLMATLGDSQKTTAHCALCVILHMHGRLSPSQIIDKLSSTSRHWASVPQTFPKLSQVILCFEGSGPWCAVFSKEFISRNVEPQSAEVWTLQDRVANTPGNSLLL